MPTTIQESIISLEITPAPPTADSKSAVVSANLPDSSESNIREYSILKLENEFVRVSICPDLGGRIVEMVDKRTETEILALPTTLPAIPEFGANEWPFGIEWIFGTGRRLDRLASVQCMLIHAPSEEEPGGLLLGALTEDTDWSIRIMLPPDQATILVEQRIHNRALHATRGDCGMHIHGSKAGSTVALPTGLIIPLGAGDSGVTACWQSGEIEHIDATDSSVSLVTQQAQLLGPRAVLTTNLVIQPFSGIGSPTFAADGIVGCIAQKRLKLQVSTESKAYKTILVTDGQTFESVADLSPKSISDSDLSALPLVKAIVIKASDGSEVVRWPSNAQDQRLNRNDWVGQTIALQLSREIQETRKNSEEDWRRLRRIPGAEAASYWIEAIQAISRADWHAADVALEQGIGFAAEDQLFWWLRAAIQRESGVELEESQERLNAHFLAPLEPALRAEAFLSMPQAQSSEPNPIVKPLVEYASHGCAVLCLYAEVGLLQSMYRIGDELLRHQDIPLVRYILAATLLEHSKMETTAGEHVVAAAKLGFGEPLPRRQLERHSVALLSARFPQDKTLRQFAAWADQNPPEEPALAKFTRA
ncbi:DUF5107 domain-containing protein [Kamptonema cortianum]|nr:DUF5107 domain-containing protein [Geitlerinema splendidum]MDK3162428.1 DUF5107 domain-containing protein [Kamptonema cortianum]